MLTLRTTMVLAMLAPVFLHAQGPELGIKAGLNVSTFMNNEVDDGKSRVGLTGGLFARSQPDAHTGAQVELLYTAKGKRNHYEAFSGLIDQDVDFRLDYLELPVMVSFRLADGLIDLHAGVYAAYLIGAHVSTSGDLGSPDIEADREDFQAFDAGLAAGVAVNFMRALQLGVRYEHGLMGVANSDASDLALGDATNACASFYLGFGLQH